MRSIIIAISAMTMPANRLWPVCALRMVLRTSQPMSAKPPMMAAMMTIESAAMIDWLTPIMMFFIAVGTCTDHKSWRSVQPDMRPDSTISAGTSVRPSSVFRTIGGIA